MKLPYSLIHYDHCVLVLLLAGMILDGLRLMDVLVDATYGRNMFECHSLLSVPRHLFHVPYTLLQTYFIFKYHKVGFHFFRFLSVFILVLVIITLIKILVSSYS